MIRVFVCLVWTPLESRNGMSYIHYTLSVYDPHSPLCGESSVPATCTTNSFAVTCKKCLKVYASHTVDGVKITPGLRVYGYDGEWGTVVPEQFGANVHNPDDEYFDGWYKVKLDSGRVTIYNGVRMRTNRPT